MIEYSVTSQHKNTSVIGYQTKGIYIKGKNNNILKNIYIKGYKIQLNQNKDKKECCLITRYSIDIFDEIIFFKV